MLGWIYAFKFFLHGQLYVALGRVTRRSDMLVVVSEDSKHKEDGSVILLNKVRRELPG